MHYIKCTECGSYNEFSIKSDAYCYVCTARFENSFSNWKIKNPKGTLEAYLETQCVPEKKVLAETEKTRLLLERKERIRERLKPLLKMAAMVLLVLAGIAILGYFARPYLKDIATML